MNWNTIDKSCESVPFVVVDTPEGNIRLWWSLRPGTYGNQVYGFAINLDKCEKDGTIGKANAGHFYKTGGCGYCKESAALEHLLLMLNRKPRGMNLGAEGIPYQYKVGGNYYKIPKKDWLKIHKRQP